MKLRLLAVLIVCCSAAHAQSDSSFISRICVVGDFGASRTFRFDTDRSGWSKKPEGLPANNLPASTEMKSQLTMTPPYICPEIRYILPKKNPESYFSHQWGIRFSFNGFYSGTSEGEYAERFTVDTVISQGTGAKYPVDSVLTYRTRDKFQGGYGIVGLSYTLCRSKSENWVWNYGVYGTVCYFDYTIVETVQTTELSYSPSIHEPIITATLEDEYGLKPRTTLFQVGIPISVQYLLPLRLTADPNSPKEIKRQQMRKRRDELREQKRGKPVKHPFEGNPRIYYGFQLTPEYFFGKYNNMQVSAFNVRFGVKATFFF